MKFTKLSAALFAATLVITPFSFSDSALLTPSAMVAEGTAATLPEWIPNDFDSAVEFRNTYGATHIDNGLVCVVSVFKREPVPEGQPQGMVRYETQITDKSIKKLQQTTFGSDISSYYYEIDVFDPQKAGDFDIVITDSWAEEPDPGLEYGHALARYSFSAKDDMNITETDIFSWLPDGKAEFSDYLRDNGEVSVKDNYVVFSTMTVDQFGDRWEPDSNNKYENIKYLLTSDCTMQARDMYDDGSVDIMYVYQAEKDGYEKISWTRTSQMRPDQQEPTPYTLTADCAVLDNAQTILLSGQMRANLIDFHTGEPIMLRAADNTYIWTDFSDGNESTGPIFMLETNPAIVNDLGNSMGSEGFSFGLEGQTLPSGYSFICDEVRPGYYGGHIIPDGNMTVTTFDNGAADVKFWLKFTPTGDANGDGKFDAADAVLLQKWLLAVPDVHLANWKAVDFYKDDKLNAADLTLMKQALVTEPVHDYVEPDEHFEYGVPFFVKRDGLKLYLGPDESYEAVASIPANTRLIEKGVQNGNNDWLFTEYNGQYGWINTLDSDGKMVIYFEEAARKPVIYLYPEEETDVHVELELTESELNTTYPKYDNGWDVVANPDGTLLNKADGSHHRYLFWDAVNCRTRFDFSTGFCVAGSDTERFLKEKLTYMGLTVQEMNEFIVYWLPLMEHNAYNLISFQGDAYSNSAKLTVTPAPDSECRIFMAYVPLESPVEIEPQQLEPFERKGFAVVEWGGVEIQQ